MLPSCSPSTHRNGSFADAVAKLLFSLIERILRSACWTSNDLSVIPCSLQPPQEISVRSIRLEEIPVPLSLGDRNLKSSQPPDGHPHSYPFSIIAVVSREGLLSLEAGHRLFVFTFQSHRPSFPPIDGRGYVVPFDVKLKWGISPLLVGYRIPSVPLLSSRSHHFRVTQFSRRGHHSRFLSQISTAHVQLPAIALNIIH